MLTYGNNAPAKLCSIFRHGSFQASTTVQMRIALFSLTLEMVHTRCAETSVKSVNNCSCRGCWQ